MSRIKIFISSDRLGSWIIQPVSKKLCKEISKCIEPSFYVQSDIERESFAESLGLSSRELKDIDAGWTIVILIDAQNFFQYYGDDFRI